MSGNETLRNAKKVKNDEFYTCLSDIENELRHYREQFIGKVVYCNCDDYRKTNYVRFFKEKFDEFCVERLIATNYDIGEGAYRYEYDGVNEHVERLSGDGDFRSGECVEILKNCDVAVTNVPFSLFREYVKLAFEIGVDILIIGNNNAITYKEVFPLLKSGALKIGFDSNQTKTYIVPDDCEKYDFERDGVKYAKIKSSTWFTTLDKNSNDVKRIVATKTIDDLKLDRYDNYDAYEVGRLKDFPCDLPVGEAIGVPITIMAKVESDGLIHVQTGETYEFVRFRKGDDGKDLRVKKKNALLQKHYQTYQVVGLVASAGYNKEIVGMEFLGVKEARCLINGKKTYARVLIRRTR